MNEIWASKGWKAYLLLPVTGVFYCIVSLRKLLFEAGLLKVNKFTVPVIVVGNISVGGTGKTPITSALVKRLKVAGFNPGIVSRGYGATPTDEPRAISADTPVELAGDEPLLLARDTGVPICICNERSAAVRWLIKHSNVDVVVSDDGLQHYAMHRDYEIAVVDGQRNLGNGWLLPAGPLREPRRRLRSVDVIAVQQVKDTPNAYQRAVLESLHLNNTGHQGTGSFCLEICTLRNLYNDQCIDLASLQGQIVHAVAGLGNPTRFFSSLKTAGLELIEHPMPDHHQYLASDITFNDEYPVLVTSKDAVKISALKIDLTRVYDVSVVAKLDEDLGQAVDKIMTALSD